MKILVTGATGFIGQKLVPKLLEQNYTVRTFGRSVFKPPSGFPTSCLEHVHGDITEKTKVIQAVSDCDIVFHLAGLVSYRKVDRDRQYAVNVLGTRNVMEAALTAGVKRVIHTSSIAAMGIPKPGTIGTEDIEYNLAGQGLNYCDSKCASEREVLNYAERGLPAIILCPGIIFGEGDTHPHHRAIFLAMSKGWLIGWPKGGVTFCDIDDVVQAHLNAITMGRTGHRYVLGSANLTYREAALVLARVFGSRPPRFEIPGTILNLAATVSESLLPLIGKTPSLTRQSAWLSQQTIFFSWDKAQMELKTQVTPFEETVRRTAPYYLNSA